MTNVLRLPSCVCGPSIDHFADIVADADVRGEALLLQWLAKEGHLMKRGDLKTAFQSGDVDPTQRGGNALYIYTIADLKPKLHLDSKKFAGPKSSGWFDKRTFAMASTFQQACPRRWFCSIADGPMHLDFALVSVCPSRCSLPSSSSSV